MAILSIAFQTVNPGTSEATVARGDFIEVRTDGKPRANNRCFWEEKGSTVEGVDC